MYGEGVENPYRVTPISAKVPIGMKYNHRVALLNPHSDTLVIREVRFCRPGLTVHVCADWACVCSDVHHGSAFAAGVAE
jgi:hypothetical protein